MEGQPMVSYSTGSMNSLVDKLTKLENPPNKLLELQEALSNLQKDFFDKLARRREINLQVEAWVKHVGELVLDIEDWVDQGHEQIEEETKNYLAQIEHARELCDRYILDIDVPTDFHDPAVAPSNLKEEIGDQDSTDELLRHLTSEEKRLKVVSIFGVEGLGKTTLAKKIFEKLQGEFECRAFVTLGRRPSMRETLMDILRQVKLSNLSRKKKANRSQKNKKVKPKTNPGGERGTTDQDLQNLISEIWEHLRMERYFILVDGIWSRRAWRIINCALPCENNGSRVLTTTCISEVAKCCSVHPTDVHRMEALSKGKSRSLYDQENIQRKEWPAEVTTNMISMCGGMPLAITIAAGLVTSKYEELAEPKMSVVSSVELYSTSEGMKKILQMSYAALSLPLKSCFLYLSVFREDYIIKKDRLIRLWMAENFIPRKDHERRGQKTRDKETRGEGVEETRGQEKIDEGGEQTRGDGDEGGKQTGGDGAEEISSDKIILGETSVEESLWETGESYFNELIMRRLIQPVLDYDDYQAVACTVHSVVLGFIKSLASNGNFVTFGTDLKSGLFPGSRHTVRRFSLDCYDDQDKDGTLASVAMHLPRVRSITVLGDIEGISGLSALTVSGEIEARSVLSSFKLIRVLDLEDTDHLRSRHLDGIGGLVLLRHLGVAGTEINKLPEEIGELEQLETLDLRGTTKLSILPASIARQKRLAHLLIDYTVKLPREILKMQGLEEVSTIGVDGIHRSIEQVVELVKKSAQLRVLGVRLGGSHPSDNKGDKAFIGHARGLFEKFASSSKLRSLSLECHHEDLLGLLLESSPFNQLQRFQLTISTPILRGTALKMASIVNVTHMDIEIIQLNDDVVRVLGHLPKLVLLKLLSTDIINSQSKKGMKNRCTVGADHGFDCLKVFSLICQYGGTELEFTQGAMRNLQMLSLVFSARKALSLYGNFSFGIQNLSSLVRVEARIDCKSATASQVNNAKDAIREQLGNFSVVPPTQFITLNQHMMLPNQAETRTSMKQWVNGLLPSHKKLSSIVSGDDGANLNYMSRE